MAQLSLFKSRKQRGTSPPRAKEFQLQCAVADILERWKCDGWRTTHLPFGEYRGDGERRKITGARLKRMGTKRGYSDFMLLKPHPPLAHFLELKREGETLTDAQEDFQTFCGRNGYPYAVADNLRDAVQILKEWGAVRVSVSV